MHLARMICEQGELVLITEPEGGERALVDGGVLPENSSHHIDGLVEVGLVLVAHGFSFRQVAVNLLLVRLLLSRQFVALANIAKIFRVAIFQRLVLLLHLCDFAEVFLNSPVELSPLRMVTVGERAGGL